MENFDKIADEAGYSKATIYNYFESKDDIFVAVAAKVFEKLYHTFESILKQSNVKFELRSLGDAYVIFLDDYPDYAGFFDPSRLGLAISRMIKKEETNQPLG